MLGNAAGQAGVNFVDVRSTFAGHGVCGNAGAYLNGLSEDSGSGGGCTWSVAGQCIIPGIPIIGSFHPNASGHASGYAAAFEAYIASATNHTPGGYPGNPVPLPDPPFTVAAAADNVQTLTTQPVTTGSRDCEGTYQAGQQLTVAGDGITPGASVSMYATSPGLGATGEQQIGQVGADSAGHVAATIRIPLQATGFTQSGAKAGVAFIDAIGSGSSSSHVDDVAMIGLAPHTSTCGTVETYPFSGFDAPIANQPQINAENAGRTIPVKFTLTGSNAGLSDVLAAGYPQSAPVSCASPATLTTGDATSPTPASYGPPSDKYNYQWMTDKSWTGCRELIVKLVDGTYHRALFAFS